MAKNKKNRLLEQPPAVASTTTSTFLGWLGVIWAAVVIYLYWDRFSWIANPPNIPPLSTAPTQWIVFFWDLKALALAGTALLGSAALGSYLLRAFKLSWSSSLEEKVFAVGFGLASVGLIIFALGLLQLYRAPIFWGLWVAGLVLAWMRWFRGRGFQGVEAWMGRINHWHGSHLTWWPHIAMLWTALAVAVVMGFVPEIFYDSMVYHLGVPNWWLHEGGIKYYPAIHAQFPFLRQMLNVWGLALNGERVAKLLHASSGFLIVATYYVLSRRYSFPKTAIIASLALLTMPMVNMNLCTAGIDIGLTSFALLGFLAWLNGLTTIESRGKWFTLAGMFGGFCFSSKYPGLIFVACLCLTTLFWIGFIEKNWKSAIRESVRIGGITVLVTLPWLIKSWVLTGNPIYPYLFHIFKSRDLFPDRALDFMSDTQTGAKKELLPLLLTPWTQTMTTISSFSSPGTFFLGFMGFMMIGVMRKDVRRPGYVASVIFFALYWYITNAMTDRIRLGIPGIAVGCFLLAHPAGYFYERGGKTLQTLIALLVAIGAFTGLLSTFPTIAESYVPWDILAGRESAQAYLSYTHLGMDPLPAMPIFTEAKALMTPGNRLLIIGDEKTSICPIPYLASGVHNNSLIVQWSREAQSMDDLVNRFSKNHVSHVALNIGEAQRLSVYKILDFDDRSLGIYCEFFEKHLRQVRSAQIVERFFKRSSPLLLYEFSPTPAKTPPSENVLLELYEDFRVPTNDPLVAKKRADILENVLRDHPGLASVKTQLDFWRSQEKAVHAK